MTKSKTPITAFQSSLQKDNLTRIILTILNKDFQISSKNFLKEGKVTTYILKHGLTRINNDLNFI